MKSVKSHEQNPRTEKATLRDRAAKLAGRVTLAPKERLHDGADSKTASHPGSRNNINAITRAMHRNEGRGTVKPGIPYKGNVRMSPLAKGIVHDPVYQKDLSTNGNTGKIIGGHYNYLTQIVIAGESAFGIVSKRKITDGGDILQSTYGVVLPSGINYVRQANTIQSGHRKLFANVSHTDSAARSASRFRVGRSISPDDSAMTRAHFDLTIGQDGGIAVHDLESLNGTHVIDIACLEPGAMSRKAQRAASKLIESYQAYPDSWDPVLEVSDPLGNSTGQ